MAIAARRRMSLSGNALYCAFVAKPATSFISARLRHADSAFRFSLRLFQVRAEDAYFQEHFHTLRGLGG